METTNLELSRLFVKVVQHGGYSKASKALRIPKSTLSKAITKLEADTGTKLLIRTTRSQTLTAAGRRFYEACLEPIQALESAQKSLYGQDNIISGQIKITAPEDLGNFVITPILSRLCVKYPLLDFETHYTNEVLDLVKDGFDLAVRIGELKESSLKQRKIGESEMILVASPVFLKGIKKIEVPKNLEGLNGIALASLQTPEKLLLKNDRKTATINIKTRIRSNQMSSVISAALAGAGVALVPSYLAREHLANGTLVRILSDWHGPRFPVSLVSPTSMVSSSRLSILTSEIISECKNTLQVQLL